MTNAARIVYYWNHRTPEQLLSSKKRKKAAEQKRVATLEWKREMAEKRSRRHILRDMVRQSVKLDNICSRAKGRGLEFGLAFLDVEIPEFCPILGLRLSFSSDGQSPNAPSLDRIDNSKGYVKGNVQVISFRANVLKRDGTPSELVALGEWAKKFRKINV